MTSWALISFVCACTVAMVTGHGYILSPPGRSSLWRYNPRAMTNYRDNELNCGSRYVQWEVNKGKCGVCGDPYTADGSRQPNQPPGVYAQPIIGKCYTAGTKHMDVYVKLTANHLGNMEFRLCPNNNFSKPVTQECMDQNLLFIRTEEGEDVGTQLAVTGDAYDIFLKLVIPEGMTCSQCVLQWKYEAGNSWGCDTKLGYRRCGIGYGPQETFINCADVAIVPDCSKPSQYKLTGDEEIMETDDEAKNLSENKAKVQNRPVIVNPGGLTQSALAYETLQNKAKEEESVKSTPLPTEGSPNKDTGNDASDLQEVRVIEKESYRPVDDHAPNTPTEKEVYPPPSQSQGTLQTNEDEEPINDSDTGGDESPSSQPQHGSQTGEYEEPINDTGVDEGDPAPNQSEDTALPSKDAAAREDIDVEDSPRNVEVKVDTEPEVGQSEDTTSPSKDAAASDDIDVEDSSSDTEVKDNTEPEAGVVRTELRCTAVGFWARHANMISWCNNNCIAGNCPDFICFCKQVPV